MSKSKRIATWGAGLCVGLAVAGHYWARNRTGWPEPLSRHTILATMRQVHAYQLAHPRSRHDRGWIRSTYMTGVMALYQATHDPAALDVLLHWARKHKWTDAGPGLVPPSRLPCGQTYVKLYELYHDPAMIAKVHRYASRIVADSTGSEKTWNYCDSMFGGAPVLAMLGWATGDAKYYDYLHWVYWKMVDELLDTEAGLIYRDKRYPGRRTRHGKKVLWSRGNGWVMAGIPRLLPYLRADDPMRGRYLSLLRTLAAAVLKCQGDDGLWRTNLADPEQYPDPEFSGTALFCYGLAWGVNEGVLDRSKYEPAAKRAWEGLLGYVSRSGRLHHVQGVHLQPGPARTTKPPEYAAGAFLLAGSEMLKLVPQEPE